MSFNTSLALPGLTLALAAMCLISFNLRDLPRSKQPSILACISLPLPTQSANGWHSHTGKVVLYPALFEFDFELIQKAEKIQKSDFTRNRILPRKFFSFINEKKKKEKEIMKIFRSPAIPRIKDY